MIVRDIVRYRKFFWTTPKDLGSDIEVNPVTIFTVTGFGEKIKLTRIIKNTIFFKIGNKRTR